MLIYIVMDEVRVVFSMTIPEVKFPCHFNPRNWNIYMFCSSFFCEKYNELKFQLKLASLNSEKLNDMN